MTISKSKFKLFKNCSKSLWLTLNKPEEAEQSSDTKQIEDGKEVGKYAKLYFKNTVDVTSYDENGNLDINNMIGLTNRYLSEEKEVIAEASIAVDNLFCSVDLLKLDGDFYEIIEVKATTEIKKEHYLDVAFQKYVLEKRGLKISNVYILHLNREYKRHGELNLNELFIKVNVTNHPDFLTAYYQIKIDLKDIDNLLRQKEEPNELLGPKCKECPFKAYCHKDVPSPSVLEINSLKTRYELYNSGVVSFTDVLTSHTKLNARQKAQIESYLQCKDLIIDKEILKQFTKQIRYPIYHLDFESIELPIPPCDDAWPYEQIPTQYSLHIEYEDGRLEHKEFLGDTIDPRRAIAESLVANIPDDVVVLAYNKTFECGRIKELAELYDDLRDHLLKISDNIVDLIVPFKNGSYYQKDMGGSNSIKYVLPALYPNDLELDYHALPVVHNGSEAMSIYPKMLEADPEEKQKIRDGLLQYCCLDTLAMVKVLRKLMAAVKQSI